MQHCSIKDSNEGDCELLNMLINNAGFKLLRKISFANVLGERENVWPPGYTKYVSVFTECKHNFCLFTTKLDSAPLREQ